MLKSHYARVGQGPVAYLDETYSVEKGRKRFYVMGAVVVAHSDRDPLRDELDRLVPNGWWHTTDELQRNGGRDRARELLATFRVPDETCVVVDKTTVHADDKEGLGAREAVLRRLLAVIHGPSADSHPPVELVVTEEQRDARKNNFDRSVRKSLIREGAIPDLVSVGQVPGDGVRAGVQARAGQILAEPHDQVDDLVGSSRRGGVRSLDRGSNAASPSSR